MKLSHIVLIAVSLTGCSDDDGGTTDAIDSNDATDTTDADAPDVTDSNDSTDAPDTDASDTPGDTGPGGVVLVDDPIVARASLDSHASSVTRAVAKIPDAQFNIDALAAVGDGAVITRLASFNGIPGDEPTFSISRLGIDGVPGAPVALTVGSDYGPQQSAVAVSGAAVGVTWFEQDNANGGGALRFARVDGASLTIEVAAKDLAVSGAGYASAPTLVARAGGWALLYGDMPAGGGVSTLRLALLDLDGVVVGTPVEVARGTAEGTGFSQSLVATAEPYAGGFAAMWTDGGYGASDVFFARLDASGVKVSGAHRISRLHGDGYSSGEAGWRGGKGALRQHGDGFWAVFTESHSTGTDFLDQKTSVIARLAVIDGDGAGQAHALQAPVDDKTTVSPSLHLIGGKLAVLWSYGTVIYICAGCVTDYDIHLVLLDPATLAPLGDEVVARHDADGARNGFTNPQGAFIGGQLLTTTALDFHALSFPASGAFVCAPK